MAKISLSKKEEEILNHQFKMIGEKITFEDIPEDGMVKKGKKTVPWWQVYKFSDVKQYEEWRKWASCQISLQRLNKIDLIYGFHYGYKKEEGQLELF